jgi:hypothetical protein
MSFGISFPLFPGIRGFYRPNRRRTSLRGPQKVRPVIKSHLTLEDLEYRAKYRTYHEAMKNSRLYLEVYAASTVGKRLNLDQAWVQYGQAYDHLISSPPTRGGYGVNLDALEEYRHARFNLGWVISWDPQVCQACSTPDQVLGTPCAHCGTIVERAS